MSDHKDIIEVMDKLGISNEPIPDTAKAFLFAKQDLMMRMRKVQDRLFKRYNIATNTRLSRGVRILMLKHLNN